MRTVRVDKNLIPGHPLKPDSLSEKASAHWYKLAAEIGEGGIKLSSAHGPMLALAAEIATDMDDARETVKIEGAYIRAQKEGLVMHPATRRLDTLRRDYFKALTMLGIRAAVASPPVDEDETLDELLDG
jgi:hypothetical protein